MIKRKLLAWAAMIVFALGSAACGGDDGDGGGDTVSAGEYVADICNALSQWQQTIQERGAELGALGTDAPPEEGQEALRDFFSIVIEETDTLIEDIEAAGVPDVEGGEEVAETFKSNFEDIRSALEDAQERVDELPTDSPEEFQAAAEELGAELSESFQAAASALGDLDAPALREAAEDEEACAAISS